MCIPAIGAIAGILGTVVSAYGAIQQGKAAAASAEYNAQVSQIMANDAIKRGEAEEEKARRAQGKFTGRQRAIMAARNLDIGSGSPLAILGDTSQLGQLEAETIRTDARREATAFHNQAQLQRFEGKNAKAASYLEAFGTVLGGIGSVAKQWYSSRHGSTSSAFA